MPNNGIAKILAGKTPHLDKGTDIPRCELYFSVDDIQSEFENAVLCGATLISPILERDWGDRVCYFSDPDGHILAFAEKINGGSKNTKQYRISNKSQRDTIGGIMNFEVNFHFLIPARRYTLAGGRHSVFIIHY